jgi:hypothetical protein
MALVNFVFAPSGDGLAGWNRIMSGTAGIVPKTTESATSGNKNGRSLRRVPFLAALAAIAITSILFSGSILRAAGWALVVNEAVAPADFIVVSLDSGDAGALEAADLVQSGVARRVAVFTDPPSVAGHEFMRRGLPYEDASARQIRQLGWLGVKDIISIPQAEGGTEDEVAMLPSWCDEHQVQSLVFVTASDHSRRSRWVLDRVMRARKTRVTVAVARYSSFDPEHWWHTRQGIRTEIIEFQKLALERIRHPSF